MISFVRLGPGKVTTAGFFLCVHLLQILIFTVSCLFPEHHCRPHFNLWVLNFSLPVQALFNLAPRYTVFLASLNKARQCTMFSYLWKEFYLFWRSCEVTVGLV